MNKISLIAMDADVLVQECAPNSGKFVPWRRHPKEIDNEFVKEE